MGLEYKSTEIIGKNLESVSEQLAQKVQQNDLFVNIKDFGAKGDGVADDTQSWTDAKAFITANGGIFYIPSNFTCYLPNGFDLTGIERINIRGRVKGTGTTNELKIGVRSQVVFPLDAHINWIEGLKLKIQGVKNGNVTINYASHLLLWADSSNAATASLAYTNFHLGTILTLEINSVGSSAWVNENKFFGGRITNLIIDGSYTHNHNHFYSPTLEGSTVNINRGSTNLLLNCRFEGTNTINFGNQSWGNIIVKSWEGSYGSYLRGDSMPTVTDAGISNFVSHFSDSYMNKEQVFEISKQKLNTNLNYVVKNSTGTLEVTNTGRYKNLFETDLVPIDFDLGFEFESDATLWRVYIEVFDVNKTPITTEPVGAVISGSLSWNTTTTKYSLGTNVNYVNAAIVKGTAAKYFKLYIQPNQILGAGQFSKFKVYFRYPSRKSFILPILTKLVSVANQKPTEGTWEIGDAAEYINPTASGYKGAICVNAGTPGTWKGYGLIET